MTKLLMVLITIASTTASAESYSLLCNKRWSETATVEIKNNQVSGVTIGRTTLSMTPQTNTLHITQQLKGDRPYFEIKNVTAPNSSFKELAGNRMSIELRPFSKTEVQVVVVNSIGESTWDICRVRPSAKGLLSKLKKISREKSIFDQAHCENGSYASEAGKSFVCKKSKWSQI